MRKKNTLISLALSAALLSASGMALANTIVPYGNGTWIYDGLYDPAGNKLPPEAGLFVKNIQDYNNAAGTDHQINEVFPYGGDIEMYCKGVGDCKPNDFLLVFYPPDVINKHRNTWHGWNQLGDSGFRSIESYKAITTKDKTPVKVIADIDGRVDVPVDQDYLDHMNDMDKADAVHFADKVAKGICANDSLDGVQFDVEPFSFNGDGGVYKGHGQQYFYTEIAKDFAGYYGNPSNPAGINTYNPNNPKDPLHCVDKAHPNGRIFSVFTFAKEVTPTVAQVFTGHDNGYIVDSLYDLGHDPDPNHPQCHSLSEFKGLVKAEVTAMSQAAAPYGLPYQFGIPAAASVHEYESGPYGTCIGAGNQIQYVQAALAAIAPVRSDRNFKGIDLWAWDSATWWHGMQFHPAVPELNVQSYLEKHL